jgi:hypothetical protein
MVAARLSGNLQPSVSFEINLEVSRRSILSSDEWRNHAHRSGVRIHQPDVSMYQLTGVATGMVSLRTFPRNFKGRAA